MPTYQERVITLLSKSPKEAGKSLYTMIESDPEKASRFLSAYASKSTSLDQVTSTVLAIISEAEKKGTFESQTINVLRWAQSTGRREDRIFPMVDLPISHSNAIRDATAVWRSPDVARAESSLAKVQEDPEWYEHLSPKKAKAAAKSAVQRNR